MAQDTSWRWHDDDDNTDLDLTPEGALLLSVDIDAAIDNGGVIEVSATTLTEIVQAVLAIPAMQARARAMQQAEAIPVPRSLLEEACRYIDGDVRFTRTRVQEQWQDHDFADAATAWGRTLLQQLEPLLGLAVNGPEPTAAEEAEEAGEAERVELAARQQESEDYRAANPLPATARQQVDALTREAEALTTRITALPTDQDEALELIAEGLRLRLALAEYGNELKEHFASHTAQLAHLRDLFTRVSTALAGMRAARQQEEESGGERHPATLLDQDEREAAMGEDGTFWTAAEYGHPDQAEEGSD